MQFYACVFVFYVWLCERGGKLCDGDTRTSVCVLFHTCTLIAHCSTRKFRCFSVRLCMKLSYGQKIRIQFALVWIVNLFGNISPLLLAPCSMLKMDIEGYACWEMRMKRKQDWSIHIYCVAINGPSMIVVYGIVL